MEDEVRRLCEELLAAEDDKDQILKLVELQGALRRHIERVRNRLGEYPLLERRSLEIPPTDTPLDAD
jgi:hypothetical protein